MTSTNQAGNHCMRTFFFVCFESITLTIRFRLRTEGRATKQTSQGLAGGLPVVIEGIHDNDKRSVVTETPHL